MHAKNERVVAFVKIKSWKTAKTQQKLLLDQILTRQHKRFEEKKSRDLDCFAKVLIFFTTFYRRPKWI